MFETIEKLLREHGPLKIEGDNRALQVAVVTLLVGAGMSNDNFRQEELEKAVELVESEFNLKDSEAGELLEVVRVMGMDSEKHTQLMTFVRENLTEDQRIRLLSMVWQIVVADGQVDDSESRFAAKVRSELGLTLEQAMLAQRLASAPK
jgi:uncharacterized tellurite resistance protein B-like protein